MSTTPAQASHLSPRPESLLCWWIARNALILQVHCPPHLTWWRNPPSVSLIKLEIFIFPPDGHFGQWSEVKWLLTSALWVTVHHNSSELLCLLTFWLVDGTPARQKDCRAKRDKKIAEQNGRPRKGELFSLGSRCVALRSVWLKVCVFRKKWSLTPIQTQRGCAVFTEVWSGLGPDWIITLSCITMKVRSSRGPCAADLANI